MNVFRSKVEGYNSYLIETPLPKNKQRARKRARKKKRLYRRLQEEEIRTRVQIGTKARIRGKKYLKNVC